MTVAELAKEVELIDIRTIGTLSRLDRGERPDPGTPVDAAISVKLGFVRPSLSSFHVIFAIDCRPRRPGVKREYARFIYRAVAQYQARQEWPDSVVDGFMKTNSLIHLWPYARQFIQRASGELGLPPVILAPFRVQPTPTPNTARRPSES